MDRLKDILTEDVGPLPVWGWAIAILGGIYLATRIGGLLGGGGEDEEPVRTQTLLPSGAVGATVGGSGAINQDVSQPLQTNNEWRQRVITGLSERDIATPVVIDQAITAWLNGADLTDEQRPIVNEAISIYGFPPDPPSSTSADSAIPESEFVAVIGEFSDLLGDSLQVLLESQNQRFEEQQSYFQQLISGLQSRIGSSRPPRTTPPAPSPPKPKPPAPKPKPNCPHISQRPQADLGDCGEKLFKIPPHIPWARIESVALATYGDPRKWSWIWARNQGRVDIGSNGEAHAVDNGGKLYPSGFRFIIPEAGAPGLPAPSNPPPRV